MTRALGLAALRLINTLAISRPGDDPIATPAKLADWVGREPILAIDVPAFNISHVRFFRELRLAIWHCARAAATEQSYGEADIEIINRYAALPGPRPQLVHGRATEISKNPRTAVLAEFAADALQLLTVHRARIRFCPNCQAAYLDGVHDHCPLDPSDSVTAPR